MVDLVDPAAEALAGRVRETLRARFSDPAYEPPLLPSEALEVLELSRHPDTPPERVLAVLSNSPTLAARVLKVARSPACSAVSPPVGLQQAVVRLGSEGIAHVVMEVALHMRVFRSRAYGPAMDRTRNHAVAVAHAGRRLARRLGVSPGTVFLTGLLHDIGVAGALIALGDTPGEAPPLEVALEAVAEVAPAAGFAMMRHWQLPGAIAAALRTPPADPSPLGRVHGVILLAHAAVANLCKGAPELPGQGRVDPPRLRAVVASVGTPVDQMRRCLVEAGRVGADAVSCGKDSA